MELSIQVSVISNRQSLQIHTTMAPEGDPPTVAPKDDYIFSRDFLDINRYVTLYYSTNQHMNEV